MLNLYSPRSLQPETPARANPRYGSALAYLWSARDAFYPSVGLPVSPGTSSTRTLARGGVGVLGNGNDASLWKRTTYDVMPTSDGAGVGDFTLVAYSNPPANVTVQASIVIRNPASPFQYSALLANTAAGVATSGAFEFRCFHAVSGTVNATVSSGATDGYPHVWMGVRRGSDHLLYRDGVLVGTTTATPIDVFASGTTLVIGGADAAHFFAFVHHIFMVGAWNRALSESDAAEIGRNPWALFAPRLTRVYLPAPTTTIAETALAATAASVGTLSSASTIAVALDTDAASTAILATRSDVTANLSAAGAAVGTLATVDVSVSAADLSTAGSATGALATMSDAYAALSGAGVAIGTLATQSDVTAALSATAAAVGTLTGEEVGAAVITTAALSAAGASTAILVPMSFAAAAINAAGVSVGTLDTGGEDNAFLTWGAHARRRRRELEEDEEEIMSLLAAMAPKLFTRRGGARQ